MTDPADRPVSRDDYAQRYPEGETTHPLLCQCGWCDTLCSGAYRDEQDDAQCARCDELTRRA